MSASGFDAVRPLCTPAGRAPGPTRALARVPGPTRAPGPAPSLDDRLASALAGGERLLDGLSVKDLPEGLDGVGAVDRRDAVLALLRIHDLHVAPREQLSGAERWQHHPAVAGLKWQLEHRFVDTIDAMDAERCWDLPADPVAAVRAVAATDRVPTLYRWLADRASLEQLTSFITLEGGPDGGFDDLVAMCQVGLGGEPKLELARNYWDEMGRGESHVVHTELHHAMVDALGIRPVGRRAQPLAALERAALGSLLATNRWLQPEMLGALGLIELQAGPRCRSVAAGLRRVSAPAGSLPFYDEHATADPRHGKQWLDNVIVPLSAADRDTGRRMARGARWRSTLNARFLHEAGTAVGAPAAPGGAARSTVLAS